MRITPFVLASRYVGIAELSGGRDHPLVQWWLSLCSGFSIESPDETPWCSAFMNGIAWELRLPRSKSAAARSWLLVGLPIAIEHAEPGFDVVILRRGSGAGAAGPDVLQAPGHVGLFAGLEDVDGREFVLVLAGNQGNAVSIARFPVDLVLGVRRLLEE